MTELPPLLKSLSKDVSQQIKAEVDANVDAVLRRLGATRAELGPGFDLGVTAGYGAVLEVLDQHGLISIAGFRQFAVDVLARQE